LNSKTLPRFWKMFDSLPVEMQRQAEEAFRRFKNDPAHPSLHFKQLQNFPTCWAARISLGYRAVCRRDGENLYWFWIGSHADFDRDFA
jgi:hypothetical protein